MKTQTMRTQSWQALMAGVLPATATIMAAADAPSSNTLTPSSGGGETDRSTGLVDRVLRGLGIFALNWE